MVVFGFDELSWKENSRGPRCWLLALPLRAGVGKLVVSHHHPIHNRMHGFISVGRRLCRSAFGGKNRIVPICEGSFQCSRLCAVSARLMLQSCFPVVKCCVPHALGQSFPREKNKNVETEEQGITASYEHAAYPPDHIALNEKYSKFKCRDVEY